MLRPSLRVALYAGLVLTGLCAALVLARPEPAVAVTPFAVFLAIGWALGAPPPLAVTVAVDRRRIVEDERVTVTVTRGARTEVRPQLDSSMVVVEDDTTDTTRTLTIAPERWGVFDVGTVAARSVDALRLWSREAVLASPVAVRVVPRADRLARVAEPAELAPFVGQHRSRARGEGFELADLRPYAIGDRAGSVNWRATARRGELWVNQRHPERVGDVVLLLDTFGDTSASRADVLDRAVRTVAAVAAAYQRTHDRVGLLTFGGHVRWLRPGSGRLQVLRIVDTLLDAERLLTLTWAGVLRVPPGALPARSLLVAVTALDSDTAVHAVLDLRARGFDLAVLTMSSATSAIGAGARLDALVRDARRRRLQRFGVAVASVDDGISAAIEEVAAWRRRSRSAR